MLFKNEKKIDKKICHARKFEPHNQIDLSFEKHVLNIWGHICKGGFFSESAICFSNLQISKKKYSKKTILNLQF